MDRRSLSLVIAAAIASVGFPAVSVAQQFPTKPLRIVVGTPPGGALDTFSRLLAPKLQERLKQQVIVENKVGAAGMIAAQFVSRSAPDGTTLLFDAVGLAMNPSMNQKLPYEPNGLQPVAKVITLPFVLLANPKIPAKNLTEAVTYLRSNSEKVNFAYAGTSTRLAGEQFRLAAGFSPTMVPYNGGAPAVTALLAGDTDFYMSDLPGAYPFITSGKLRAIALSGPVRSTVLPDVPTVKESGVDYALLSWYGFFAPTGTPQAILDLLNQELHRAAVLPDVRERIVAIGAEPAQPTTVQEFSQLYHSEIDRWKEVVKRAQIPVNQ